MNTNVSALSYSYEKIKFIATVRMLILKRETKHLKIVTILSFKMLLIDNCIE